MHISHIFLQLCRFADHFCRNTTRCSWFKTPSVNTLKWSDHYIMYVVNFAREGVPLILITDNDVQQLKSDWPLHARHPASNGKSWAISTSDPKHLGTAQLLAPLQKRARHTSSAGKTTAMLFKGRNWKLDFLQKQEFKVRAQNGNQILQVLDRHDATVHRRHIDLSSSSPLPISSPRSHTPVLHPPSVVARTHRRGGNCNKRNRMF